MPNVSPRCGICHLIENLPTGKVKDDLVSALNSDMFAQDVLPVLEQAGLKVARTTVARHRNSCDINHEKITPSRSPSGWEPYSEFTESIGSAIVRLPTPGATARDLLISAGFDPDAWQISGSINTRKWMRYDQEWLYYYKFDVVAGESPEIVEEHITELVKYIRQRKIKHSDSARSGNDAFVFAASDWQIGKAEGSDGTSQTIERVLTSIELAEIRIKELRKQGRKIPTLLFAGLGDLGEGTCGFYPGQLFLIDRNRREQGRINRELITRVLDRLSPLFDHTIVAAVGGNHGENRSPKGERLTSDGDNDDCAYFEAVKEAFDRAGHTDIDWRIMNDELSMSINIDGVNLGLTHGHLFRKGATAQQKAFEWWKGQDFGFQPVRDTRILLTGHFHHFSAIAYGARTHIQAPAMDPGSKWFRDSSGQDSPPGTLTFRLAGDSRLGWDDLAILDPNK